MHIVIIVQQYLKKIKYVRNEKITFCDFYSIYKLCS